MDFFHAQDQARRNTVRLVAYFALAVAIIVVAVYLAVALLLQDNSGDPQYLTLWDPDLFVMVAAGTLLLILGGTLYKLVELATGGGAAVAAALGGRPLERDSAEPAERRLLNVVEEMAIASGLPAPPVYVLDEEMAINAFAAGSRPSEAVVAVTRGALEQLSRDELQGVVGHEFSHILNGDMRLNLRIIGLLHGILLLALIGRSFLHGSSRSRRGGGGLLFGLALLAIGYVGVLFGHLIKAAVSRQREYLADASAVQFTRNPAGIAGALRKIAGAGSRLDHPRADEASHMFFGEGVRAFAGLFATHPPLAQRIARLEPGSALVAASAAAPLAAGVASGLAPQALAATVGTVRPAHVAYARRLLAQVPESLRADLRQGLPARCAVYGLLLSSDDAVAAAQLALVAEREGEAVAQQVENHAAQARALGQAARLPLVDLALPALDRLTAGELAAFIATVDALVRADRRLDLFEFTLSHILRRHLLERPRRADLRHDADQIRADLALLFSYLAHAGADNDTAVRQAFRHAAQRAPFAGPWELVAESAATLAALGPALSRLEGLQPRFKRTVVEACAAAVAADGQVGVEEAELLRAVCEALECPLPPVLAE